MIAIPESSNECGPSLSRTSATGAVNDPATQLEYFQYPYLFDPEA